MINDNTILSSFNDRPTLLEWLKKVEEALKSDTATAIKFENTSPNHYIASIEFANGNKIVSGDIAFPDTIEQVSVTDGELIINYVSGRTDNLGQLNAYEGVIVINSETNTTEIGNNLQVNGTITAGGNVLSAVVANPTEETTGTLSSIKIGNTAYAVGGGGGNWLYVQLNYNSGDETTLIESATISEQDVAKIVNGEVLVISGTYRKNSVPYNFYSVLQRIENRYPQKVAFFKGTFNTNDNAQDLLSIGLQVASDSTTLQATIKTII